MLRVELVDCGLVVAEGIAGQGVAGGGEGAGAGAAAEGAELAVATLAFEQVGIVQRLEHGGVAVDVLQLVVADVAEGEGKEAGGADVSLVGDEHDAVAVADAEAAIDGRALDLGGDHAGLRACG